MKPILLKSWNWLADCSYLKEYGTESPLTEIGRAFEYLFNIKLGDIHKKHENVISRKANKRTEFLDILRKAISEESKKKGYL